MPPTLATLGRVKTALALLLISAATAGAGPAARSGPVEAELVLRDLSLQPGTPALALVRLTMDEGWHVYASDPGEAGLPTTLTWELPQGFTSMARAWPAPRSFEDGGIATRGYEGELLLLTEITPPQSLAAGTEAAVRVRVDWLACRQECVPGTVTLDVVASVSSEAPRADERHAALFRAAEVLLASGTGAPASGAAPVSLLLALLLAFAGGIILNLMPCVLPVLSLKVVGFVNRPREAGLLAHGLLYGAGVLVSFWAIAGILAAFAAGGRLLGWGFQFQDPAVVAAVALLFFLIGLNLFGVFEVGTRAGSAGAGLRSRKDWLGSLAGGLFMTAVATPCTAPFMGAALGYALAQPPAVSFAVFTALGLGLALPYVLLSSLPALAKLLPKPGPWMETLRNVMGFPMMAAVIWFVALESRLAGSGAVSRLLVGLLACSLGAWIWGRWGRLDRSRGSRIAAAVLAAVLVAGGGTLAVAGAVAGGGAPARASAREAAGEEPSAEWEAWSPERLAELRAAGTPVFVDYTAAWCLTCQLNEATTLRNRRVLDRFRQLGVALLRADWTNQDATIARSLEGFGRAGVPLYVLYGRDGAEPVILPEIVTPAIVLAALE